MFEMQRQDKHEMYVNTVAEDKEGDGLRTEDRVRTETLAPGCQSKS